MRRSRGAFARLTQLAWLACIALLGTGCAPDGARTDVEALTRGGMRFGVGDRLTLEMRGRWRTLVEEAERVGAPLDLLEIWLTRDWQEDWLPQERLAELATRGTTPILVHWYFGDTISKERIRGERSQWHASLRRLGRVADRLPEALVLLEPEFNNAPPPGETRTTAWPGFGDEIRRAAAIVRREAPRAWVGICAGDFYPDLDLEVLERAVPALDFLAFQEMRASTDPERHQAGYLQVGRRAVRYARHLRTRFGKPILLAYVAVSSHGGWERHQAHALRDLARVRPTLERLGVFGVVYFQLVDDPAHRGYFGAAERSFGLLTAAGRPKPGFKAFQQLAGGGTARAPRSGADSRSAPRPR